MKRPQIYFLLFIIGTLISGCKKYEEGPSISFRSKEARVSNTWKVASYTINGEDKTSLLTNVQYTETYDKEGNYSYASSASVGSGKWEFQSDDEQIKRSGVASQSSEILYILKLKENKFWYYILDGNDRHEFHLEEN